VPGKKSGDHWETVHAEKQDAVSWFQQAPETSLELLLQDGLAEDAAIIDVGAGASRLVDSLLEKGYRNLAVLDIADSGLARARERLGARAAEVDWIVADITAWKPEHLYDAWHDRAVFHFLVDGDDREAYRRALRAGLKVGGRLVMGTFADDGPEKCSGLPVRRYSAQALAREIGEGFEMEHARIEMHRTPTGNRQNFQFVVFKRIS